MKLHESAENYLEAILNLTRETGSVRAVDIANHMAFSQPSVSRAVNLLRENGYLTVGQDGRIRLTDAGREIAERINERHRLLTLWLTSLGVEPATAAEDACRIEHDISEPTFERLKEHILKDLEG